MRAHHVTSTSAVITWLPSNSNHQHAVCVNNVEVRTVRPGVYRHTITGKWFFPTTHQQFIMDLAFILRHLWLWTHHWRTLRCSDNKLILNCQLFLHCRTYISQLSITLPDCRVHKLFNFNTKILAIDV